MGAHAQRDWGTHTRALRVCVSLGDGEREEGALVVSDKVELRPGWRLGRQQHRVPKVCVCELPRPGTADTNEMMNAVFRGSCDDRHQLATFLKCGRRGGGTLKLTRTGIAEERGCGSRCLNVNVEEALLRS